MTTTTRRTALPRKTKSTSTDSVKFSDGMIVTAEDLAAAQQYPVSLLQTVLRAYFGCGVVCGLNLTRKQQPQQKTSWILCVDRGVAIDCDGRPIELCGPVELDLSPEACSCEDPPPEVFILIRRVTSDEPSSDPCSCNCSCSSSCSSDADAPQFDCRRTREGALIQAFSQDELDALQAKVCRRSTPTAGAPAPSLCAAWTTCSSCGCAESWILLGSVPLTKQGGITADPDQSQRSRANPIEVLCTTLEDRLAKLEKQVSGPAAPNQP